MNDQTTTLYSRHKKGFWGIIGAIIGIVIIAIIAPWWTSSENGATSENDSQAVRTDSGMYLISYREDFVTRITDSAGKIIFDDSYNDDDQQLHDSLERHFFAKSYFETDAVLNVDGAQITGTVELSATTDDVATLAKVYNEATKSELSNLTDDTPRFSQVIPDFTYQLNTIIEQTDLEPSTVDPVQLIADEKTGDTRSNSTVTDAYKKGLAAWQVAQGSSDYSYENEYTYDFSCTEYRFDEGDNAAVLSRLNELLAPSLHLQLKVTNMPGTYLGDTAMPCDLVVNGDDSSSLKFNKIAPPAELTPPPSYGIPGNTH